LIPSCSNSTGGSPYSFANQHAAPLVSEENHWAFSDLYVAPLNLGWTTSRADFIAGYAFSAPTGKYEVGGSDNQGLGMWSHELQGGTTVYLDLFAGQPQNFSRETGLPIEPSPAAVTVRDGAAPRRPPTTAR
jgi:hypothetical protein